MQPKGYLQPRRGLAEDLMAAGQAFLQQQAAPVVQAIAPSPTPTAPRPVVQSDTPTVTARPMQVQDQAPSGEFNIAPIAIFVGIIYLLFKGGKK